MSSFPLDTDKLLNIDPYEFEELIAELWSNMGWNTEVSDKSNDKGVDVVAIKQDVFKTKQMIQVKRYNESNKVGSPEIQQYSSLIQQEKDADMSLVVTTSKFTENAKKMAKELNVKTINGEQLIKLIQKHGGKELLKNYLKTITTKNNQKNIYNEVEHSYAVIKIDPEKLKEEAGEGIIKKNPVKAVKTYHYPYIVTETSYQFTETKGLIIKKQKTEYDNVHFWIDAVEGNYVKKQNEKFHTLFNIEKITEKEIQTLKQLPINTENLEKGSEKRIINNLKKYNLITQKKQTYEKNFQWPKWRQTQSPNQIQTTENPQKKIKPEIPVKKVRKFLKNFKDETTEINQTKIMYIPYHITILEDGKIKSYNAITGKRNKEIGKTIFKKKLRHQKNLYHQK